MEQFDRQFVTYFAILCKLKYVCYHLLFDILITQFGFNKIKKTKKTEIKQQKDRMKKGGPSEIRT